MEHRKREYQKRKTGHWKVWIIFLKQFQHQILLKLSVVWEAIRLLTGYMMMVPCMKDDMQ